VNSNPKSQFLNIIVRTVEARPEAASGGWSSYE
jgi:hypothetical protein